MKNRDQKDSVVKSIIKYSSSNIYRQVAGLFYAFIKPKLLAPELYGLWSILNLIPTYASYTHLGSKTILKYKIPYCQSRNEQQLIEEIKGSVFMGSLYINLVISIGIAIYAYFEAANDHVKYGLFTMSIIVMLRWYCEYYTNLLKAYQDFKLISSSNYLRANVTLFSGVILIYYFKIYGVYLTALISNITIIGYFLICHPIKHSLKLNCTLFAMMVKEGFPIMFFTVAALLISTSDRIVVSYLLGTKSLGYYGIVVVAFEFLMNIPGATREIIEPKLMQDINSNSVERNMDKYFFQPMIGTAYFMPFLIGLVVFLLPLAIPILLPNYIESILITQIVVIGSYFFALAFITRGIIVVNQWQLSASIVVVLALFLNVSLSIFLVKIGWDIIGVAIGTSISYFLLFIILMTFLRFKLRTKFSFWRRISSGTFIPFFIMLTLIISLKYLAIVFHLNVYVANLSSIVIFITVMLAAVKIAKNQNVLVSDICFKKIWKK